MKCFSYSYWSNLIADKIYENVPEAQNKSREEIEYGAYMALSEVSKITIMLAIGTILHVFWYVIGIIMLFGLLRWNLGGVHAKTHWVCLISYFGTIYGILGLSYWLPETRIALDIVVIPTAYIITYLYAPADMPVKPVVSKKQRKRLRITGFVLLSILFASAQFVGQVWFYIIMLTIALTAVLMTPPIYKLTRNKYAREEVSI